MNPRHIWHDQKLLLHLHLQISGSGWYKKPAGWAGVEKTEGEPFRRRAWVGGGLEAIVGKLDSIIYASSADNGCYYCVYAISV